MHSVEALMRKLFAVVAVSLLAAAGSHAAPPASQRGATDTPKIAFIKKCIRNVTKASCTAPPEARVPAQQRSS
jgi:hypothetical protein